MENLPDGDKNLSMKNAPDLNEILVEWKSPSHPFKKRNRLYYQTIIAMTFLLVAIVFFLNDFLLIGVIISLAFVVYAISSVPPVDVEHKVTPMGFDHAGRFYKWMELSSFWFEEKWDQMIIVIQTHLSFPVQVRAVIDKNLKDKIKESVSKYLLFHEKPVRSWSEKISEWLSKKIPLDSKI